MNASVMTPQGHGVRQPSGVLPGEPSCASAAKDRRTPRRWRAIPTGGLLTAVNSLRHGAGGLAPLHPSRLCGCLVLVLWCLASVGGAFAQSPTTNTAVRFRAVDVFVDSGATPLAAYQLEFAATNGNARIVGIEGGEHPAFAQPPFYDPKAMQHERIIIAAFSTEPADKLPRGKTRVATIHVQTSGSAELKPEISLRAAAGVEGKRITAVANSDERKPK